jgi:hypothetical protein
MYDNFRKIIKISRASHNKKLAISKKNNKIRRPIVSNTYKFAFESIDGNKGSA